jgi:hypothetical protein
MYDVADVLDPEIGWPNKQQLSLSLRGGETQILALTPAEPEEEALPE